MHPPEDVGRRPVARTLRHVSAYAAAAVAVAGAAVLIATAPGHDALTTAQVSALDRAVNALADPRARYAVQPAARLARVCAALRRVAAEAPGALYTPVARGGALVGGEALALDAVGVARPTARTVAAYVGETVARRLRAERRSLPRTTAHALAACAASLPRREASARPSSGRAGRVSAPV